jgi:hypothetical protein
VLHALQVERGYGHVYETWPGERIDAVLAWTFSADSWL